jgi:hypothetical protein
MGQHIGLVREEAGVHFLIPPPSEKSTVHDPCLCADIGHGVEEGLHEGGEMVQLLVLSDLLLGKAAIVMGVKSDQCR